MSEDLGASSLSGVAGRMTAIWTSIGAIPAEVFLHNQFGRRYLGVEALMAIVQMGMVAMLFGFYVENTPDRGDLVYSPGPVLLYCLMYIVMLLLSRIILVLRERRGEIEHSRYNGWPRLLPPQLARFERVFKILIEPGLVFFVALKLWAFNMPLGLYLAFNAVCMSWSNVVNVRFEKQRAIDLRDAMLEQRGTAHRLRQFTHR